ncbi:LytR family transcriptional regulator [Cryobacterium sp. TMT1-21]|uniref:LytR family transcriptional regulator n=1 Tax=Cryobacterium shii TaxID=1259235 RepID=A0AAQ2C6Z7_9MICO|nr:MULTISPECIES: LCP family protein [Cryobacterium]TFC49574.1 LytR family transcriptional regulator [Cryobacterium shii]TFC89441.1 LytR family transcriptional regulator [Cryobacterium sp. TmT2-59]TFD07174.1 LytR family transcriptional regulator [Cryobacterium sp. TMT1-21]TFD15527.1 LytR family transcriptional regulator [Cryobacterium sp. TMT4-10]TFD15887.1 LytR family transcriptional regulator [Cryobacterium sp. TMT2-23]
MSDQLRPRSTRSKKIRTLARHGRLRRSNPFVTVAKVLAAALAVLLVSGVSVAAIATYDVAASVQPSVKLASETDGPAPKIDAIAGGVNLLIVGSDSRKGQDARFGPEDSTGDLNDVTMLLHISADHSNASVISFPRDMYVPIPECPNPDGGTFDSMGSQKINTTLTYGGLACTVLTVEQLTGLNIPYAAEVQFSGVMAMSTAVGGVPVCVAEDIEDEYTGTFLKAGMHTLEGVDALQFLRTRHGVGDGSDLTRISNQQVFMSSLVRTIKSASTLSDPLKVYSLAKAVTANMTLSTNLNDVSTLASIAVALKDIDLNKVVFVQVPTGTVDGGVIPLQSDFDNLFEAVAADKPIQLGGTTGGGATQDPNAPVAATPDPAAADPAATTNPSAVPDPAATKNPSDGAVLSDSTTGQTAGDYTCSVGRTLEDQ